MVQAAEKPGPTQQAQEVSGSKVAKHCQRDVKFTPNHFFHTELCMNHEVDVKDVVCGKQCHNVLLEDTCEILQG